MGDESQHLDLEARLRRDMRRAARDLLGSGYIPSYYESAASDFVFVALSYVREAQDEVERLRTQHAAATELLVDYHCPDCDPDIIGELYRALGVEDGGT